MFSRDTDGVPQDTFWLPSVSKMHISFTEANSMILGIYISPHLI